MKSALRLETMAKCCESALRQLGYVFFKNDSGTVVEFEVQTPEKFIVRIEKLEDRIFMNPMFGAGLSRLQVGPTNVTILLMNNGPQVRRHAGLFVSALMTNLPRDPWKGLGFVESLTAKSLWREWVAESQRS